MKEFEDTDREGATMDSGKLNMVEEEDHGRPITDAAVRQAVECLSSGWGEGSEASRFKAHVDTLIRAVQAPRLTEEQVKEAYLNGYEDGNEDGRALTGCRNVVEHTPRYDPDTAWAKSDTRAAFPEAFGKEG